MPLYQNSTKLKPLLFFDSFISDQNLKKYEDDIYNFSINPSHESYNELGYIEYTKDLYDESEEFKPVRVYFKETLQRLLEAQIIITNNFLTDRKNELEYQNIKADIFLDRQLKIIETIKQRMDSNTLCNDIVLSVLNTLEEKIKNLGENQKLIIPNNLNIKSNKPFFGPKVKRNTLIELYNISIDYGIIDDEEVIESDFLAVFMSNTPHKLENKIVFNVNNQVATFFLNCIMKFFEKLTHAQIVKSQSFLKKSKTYFTQTDLDTAKTRYSKKEISDEFLSFQKAIDAIGRKNI